MTDDPTAPTSAPPRAPAAFHVGPGHRIVHGNPPFVERFGSTAIGQPAREAMLGLPPKAFELMDHVLRTGKAGAYRFASDDRTWRLVVAPRIDPVTGVPFGVTTHLTT